MLMYNATTYSLSKVRQATLLVAITFAVRIESLGEGGVVIWHLSCTIIGFIPKKGFLPKEVSFRKLSNSDLWTVRCLSVSYSHLQILVSLVAKKNKPDPAYCSLIDDKEGIPSSSLSDYVFPSRVVVLVNS